MTGEIANLASRDFDADAAAAILDPQKANDDRYYRVYGKTSAGPYTVTSAQGLRMRIDEMTIDDVGVRPSRLQLPALLAMIPAAGTRIADAGAGARADRQDGRRSTRASGSEPPRCAAFRSKHRKARSSSPAIRFNLENGKIGEFAIEGLDDAHAERARQGRTLRAQVARYRQLHADVGAVREPGAAALARPGRSG